jgi:hypothetical protein
MRGAAGNPNFGVLPKSPRPAHNLFILVYLGNDFPGQMFINHSNGQVQISGENAIFLTSLAGVSFPVG